jgi:hypothetical protein
MTSFIFWRNLFEIQLKRKCCHNDWKMVMFEWIWTFLLTSRGQFVKVWRPSIATQFIFLFSEWLHSFAHRVQEEPRASDSPSAQIWREYQRCEWGKVISFLRKFLNTTPSENSNEDRASVMYSQVHIVRLLLFPCFQGGQTPMHVAAYYGNVSVVVMLLQNGGSPDVTNMVRMKIVSVK